MKIITCAQGTPEWHMSRIGRITSSKMNKVITPAKGEPSKSMIPLSYELIAEELLGAPMENVSASFMERGKSMEAEARSWYELEYDCDVRQVGFIANDADTVGCSPDGLVGTDGLIEIKCPKVSTHIGYILGQAGAKYKCQIQSQLWIAEREWCDFISYNPVVHPLVVRFQRDDLFIKKIAIAVKEMLELMDEHRTRLHELGFDEWQKIALDDISRLNLAMMGGDEDEYAA